MPTAATAEDYERQLVALLPRGVIWPRSSDSVLRRLLRAFAQSFKRVHDFACALIEEADVRTTTQLLEDWERVLDIPGPCLVLAESTARRRQIAAQRITARGGASRQYFIDLAAELDYTVTITEPRPFEWEVGAPAALATRFSAGKSKAGDPLVEYGAPDLGCILEFFRPGHTDVTSTFLQ